MIKVKIVEEAGYEPALYGMTLSHAANVEYPLDVKRALRAEKQAPRQGGHNKFLESMMLWVSVDAPRYWWQQADTYRLSTKQSASTMHTILKGRLEQSDFYEPIPEAWLETLNGLIEDEELNTVKRLLPESFMQRRLWCMSYKTLQNIYLQRRTHKLQEWRDFLSQMLKQIDHPELLVGNPALPAGVVPAS